MFRITAYAKIRLQGRRNRSGWSGGRRTNISPKTKGRFNRKEFVPAITRAHSVTDLMGRSTNGAGATGIIRLDRLYLNYFEGQPRP